MNALQRLLEKSRPYKAFNYEGEALFARRMGQVDIESAGKVWEQAYRQAKADFQDSEKEQTAIYDALNRASNDRLATIISKAEKPDFISEASSLLDKPGDNPEVIADAEMRETSRKKELLDTPHEYLVGLAYDRRYHAFAMDAATLAQVRYMTLSSIFEGSVEGYTPLFASLADVANLPQDAIFGLLDAARAALDPPKEDGVSEVDETPLP